MRLLCEAPLISSKDALVPPLQSCLAVLHKNESRTITASYSCLLPLFLLLTFSSPKKEKKEEQNTFPLPPSIKSASAYYELLRSPRREGTAPPKRVTCSSELPVCFLPFSHSCCWCDDEPRSLRSAPRGTPARRR